MASGMEIEGSLTNIMNTSAATKSRALYEKYKNNPKYDKMLPGEAQLNAKYFGVGQALGQEKREMLYNKQLMDPRAAKAFAERRGLYYDDTRDLDGDGTKDIIGAEFDGENYYTTMYNGHYITKPDKSNLPLKMGYYNEYDRDARKDKTWTDVYLKSQGKEGTPKYQFDLFIKPYLKNAINGTTLTLGDARKVLWSIVLEACFEGAESHRTNLNRLLAKKAGKAVINKILTSIKGNIESIAKQAYNTIQVYAVISSRGGDPDRYGQYQTLENTLKGMILNGEQQIAFNDWFPLSQKRSEKEDEYVNQLGDRDQWIDKARRFLNRNNINPDTFQQIQ